MNLLVDIGYLMLGFIQHLKSKYPLVSEGDKKQMVDASSLNKSSTRLTKKIKNKQSPDLEKFPNLVLLG